MLFDTHAHYYSRAFSEDRDELLRSLPEAGVGLVVCPGSTIKTSAVCLQLAEQYPHIYAAAGVHPQDAAAQLPSFLAKLSEMLDHPKVKAVGEIGLDYYYDDHAVHPVQKAVFRGQMELAEVKNLPVIVHDRDAHGDCLAIVKDFPKVRGVFHCYSGSVEDAKTLVKLGYMLSFTGNITFKNARKAPDVIRWLPMEHIMIETDAPYMTPVPFRGKRNDSRYVYRIAETIAEIKGLPLEDVIRITTENGKRFFGIVGE